MKCINIITSSSHPTYHLFSVVLSVEYLILIEFSFGWKCYGLQKYSRCHYSLLRQVPRYNIKYQFVNASKSYHLDQNFISSLNPFGICILHTLFLSSKLIATSSSIRFSMFDVQYSQCSTCNKQHIEFPTELPCYRHAFV